jgi:hypothetical protein
LFSGRWEANQNRDAEGRAFLDLEPELFRVLLGHMRDCQVHLHAAFRRELVPPARWSQFQHMINYLQVVELFECRCMFVGGASDGFTYTQYCEACNSALATSYREGLPRDHYLCKACHDGTRTNSRCPFRMSPPERRDSRERVDSGAGASYPLSPRERVDSGATSFSSSEARSPARHHSSN